MSHFGAKSPESSRQATIAIRDKIKLESDPIVNSRVAIALAHVGDAQTLGKLMQPAKNPIGRTRTILELPGWHDDLGALFLSLDYLPLTSDGDLLSGVCCALALAGPDGMSEVDRAECIARLKQIYTGHPHGGAHYAAWYALEEWGVKQPVVDDTKLANCQWKIVKIKSRLEPGHVYQIPLVRISKSSFEMGAGDEDYPPENPLLEKFEAKSVDGMVEEDYWISVFELPLDLFDEFVQTLDADDPDFLELQKNQEYQKSLAAVRHQPRWSTSDVSWIQAIRFVNWLNKQYFGAEQFDNEEVYVHEDDLNWRVNRIPGFHLPTHEQFELAQRAGSQSTYFFGDEAELLEIFCGYGSGHEPGASGLYMPNAFGCFDLSSNHNEWVEDFIFLKTIGLFSKVKGASATDRSPSFRSAYVDTFPVGTLMPHPQSFRVCLLDPP